MTRAGRLPSIPAFRFRQGIAPQLNKALICLLASLIAATAAFTLTGARHKAATTAHQAATREQEALHRQLADHDAAVAGADELRRALAAYRQHGMLTTGQPGDWIGVMESAAAARALPAPTCHLLPQPADSSRSPGLQHRRLHMRQIVLHEGDFLGILADIRQNAGAPIRIERCQLTRMAQASLPPPEDGRLLAECEIDFHTISLSPP